MSLERGFNMHDWRILLSSVFCIFVVSRLVKFLAGIKLVKGMPGPRVLFCPIMPPGAALPTSWWNPGIAFTWKWRLSFYKQWGSEFVSFVPFLLGPPMFYTSSLEVARQTVAGGYQSVWVKPSWASRVLNEWGLNIVSANNEDWRRHRRIMGPAFNTQTYSLVWAETLRIYRDMITTEDWAQKDVIMLESIQAYTIRVAFLVISACGFGLTFPWEEPIQQTENDNRSMGVQKAMRIWADTVLVRVVTPLWVYKLPFKRLRDIVTSTQVLQDYIAKMILERRAELNGESTTRHIGLGRKDVFSLLVRASEEDSKFKLTDNELVGNVFAMMFAGHETTAYTLAATIGFLGLHSEVQEEIYQKIIKVVGHDGDPTFDDFPRLEEVAYAFYEAMRLFPAGYIMIREAVDDTVLNVPNADGKPGMRQVPIPKGLAVIVDVVGIQYNPRYFADPYKYDPNRWRGVTAESEDITAFSFGPRTCLGRKFAVVEAVCFLTLLVRDWIIEPIMNSGETDEQWRERVMQADMGLTLTVKSLPVRLRRRQTRAAVPV